ncbi:MAG: hypothetical protein GY845_03295 [Planctomycetes bacterium]|nr:hypothetical protein [Planctomycetota bacterium]
MTFSEQIEHDYAMEETSSLPEWLVITADYESETDSTDSYQPLDFAD